MKTKTNLKFDLMVRDYPSLCRMFLPRPIHDEVGYENTVEIADIFAGFEDQMTNDQKDYFGLLCDLIENYDQEKATKAPTLRALDLLKHLAHEHSLSGADLSRLLGRTTSLGPMILRGERKLTITHAVTLSHHFGLRLDVFLS
jgi:antitoxin component HigA of HigAB toxin-antitoxin module